MSLICRLTGVPQDVQDCSVEPSRTKQSFADETDINWIMKRFIDAGTFPVVDVLGGPQALFGDFSDGGTLFDVQNRLIEARESFDALPALVRKRFDNDPVALLDFLADSGNRKEAEELGLIAPAGTPPAAPVVAPAGGSGPASGS